ncbi:uncharacterized protein MONBRDRAFT_27772 [Monosiga brevicollis MX1]|uniref:Uncharacterized protein n=1 Tax=Monosiga brevicollis TaxID=81824 RepID=A9V697_MONBE|nr:uncharacterized protein MONBRDRAFT_27772 [Monosiga brevicollis MX1]EDQ86953.1 predicted protein [Monosiga brevicollis MX1]|eukprot:XP_001748192.1 hypothetical protein [Monosiga brevicollis MX1]
MISTESSDGNSSSLTPSRVLLHPTTRHRFYLLFVPVHLITPSVSSVALINPSNQSRCASLINPSPQFLSVSLSICLNLCLYLRLCLYLDLYISGAISTHVSAAILTSGSCLCLFVCPSVCLSVCLSLSLSLCLCLSVSLSLCLLVSVCLSLCLSVFWSLSLCLSVCLSNQFILSLFLLSHFSSLVALVVLSSCASVMSVRVQDETCDIVVAGGSTASLAAAITAAEADASLTVCFTEITDWPGGQMTAGGVPAIDFGSWNGDPDNQPASFRDFFFSLDGNPGGCTVSTKCYLPNNLVSDWIMPRLARSKNLKVFLRTAVKNVTRDATSGKILGITAIQRTPTDPTTEWDRLFSQDIEDWYTVQDSVNFQKTVINFAGTVFIEATEFGDVLVAGGLPFNQGIEIPTEEDWITDSVCGQVWTTTFYMGLLAEPPAEPQFVPPGNSEGNPYPTTQDPSDWHYGWMWRRAFCAGNKSDCGPSNTNVGDVTQQNRENDLFTGYPLLSMPDILAQASDWKGGVDVNVLSMMEQRAYAYFHFMNATAPEQEWLSRIVLNKTTPGTGHGLSKFPYVRDTRRAIGLDNFRLTYAAFDYFNMSSPSTGFRFNDTIALGNYNDDVHHLHICTYPDYMLNHTTKPYYIPFRALTVANASNLLVAGKTMAQTFHGNGATRLHPSEWTSGVAAGGAAVLMVHQGWSTSQVYDNVGVLQAFLNSSVIGQPLEWTQASSPDVQIGYLCAFEHCIGTDADLDNRTLFKNDTCSSTCPPMGTNDWLANEQYWDLGFDKKTVTANRPTVLKKSLANSMTLPPSELLSVAAGTQCTISSDSGFGYYYCTLSSPLPAKTDK